MGTPFRYALASFLCLAPLAAACGVVTPDEGGLFASAASATDGGAGSGGDGGGPVTCGNGKVEAGEDCDEKSDSCQNCKSVAKPLQGGNGCDDPIAVELAYGEGKNVFRGSGNTDGDTSGVVESACANDPNTSTDGPDRVHAITVNAPQGGYVTARLLTGDGQTPFDAVLYARDFCTGPATFCEDSTFNDANGARKKFEGGDVLSVPVPATFSPTQLFLFVDGVTGNDKGPYQLEVTLAKGTCDDPVPVFVPDGQPVRLRASNADSVNSMQHSCGQGGTGDVIYKVTRSKAGPLTAVVDSPDREVALVVLSKTCDRTKIQQEELSACAPGGGNAVTVDDWPDANRSLFIAVDVGRAAAPARGLQIKLDPNAPPP
jgi:hypothetical protein